MQSPGLETAWGMGLRACWNEKWPPTWERRWHSRLDSRRESGQVYSDFSSWMEEACRIGCIIQAGSWFNRRYMCNHAL